MMLEKLAEPWGPGEIRHLAFVWCRECKGSGRCAQHQIKRCPRCEVNVSTAHTCRAYVPVRSVIRRLSTVDPAWTWEIVEKTPSMVVLKVTVAGVSKLGIGAIGSRLRDADDATMLKSAISRAIKHAALFFGCPVPEEETEGEEETRTGEVTVARAAEAVKTTWVPAVSEPEPEPEPEPAIPTDTVQLRRQVAARLSDYYKKHGTKGIPLRELAAMAGTDKTSLQNMSYDELSQLLTVIESVD